MSISAEEYEAMRRQERRSIVRNKLIVMPANSTGWMWHALARETGRVSHLLSAGAERGPWPWFGDPAFDPNTFPLWNQKDNTFDEDQWMSSGEARWRRSMVWASLMTYPDPKQGKPRVRWAIAPDRPGCAEETLRKWEKYAPVIQEFGYPLALAVQDGMTAETVRGLNPKPDVIAVGGSTPWKWETAEMWGREFKRAHLLRCNAPDRLPELDRWGFESCDGTGWARGNRVQTQGLEEFLRQPHARTSMPLWPHSCRLTRKAARQLPGQPVQESFA